MSELSEAKATLLRALEQLERAEDELGAEPTRADLYVVYSVGVERNEAWEEVQGWSATPGPKWMHAALLRRAADALDNPVESLDFDDEQDE